MARKNPEDTRAYSRAYYQANREKCLEKMKAYREANKAKLREKNTEYMRAWRERNREKDQEAARARYRRNRDSLQAEATHVRLCECGCGQSTLVATRNRPGRGQRKGEPLRFISGHNHNPIPPMPGELSPSWKGDKAGYYGIHVWLQKHYPKTGVCSECGRTPRTRTEWAFQRHPEPHTRDIADYREMCGSCHRRFDAEQRRQREASP